MTTKTKARHTPGQSYFQTMRNEAKRIEDIMKAFDLHPEEATNIINTLTAAPELLEVMTKVEFLLRDSVTIDVNEIRWNLWGLVKAAIAKAV